MRRRHAKLALLALLAAGALLALLLEERTPGPSGSAAPEPSAPAPADTALTLPEREPLPAYRASAPEPQSKPKPMAAAPPSVAPRMPPVPYRYAGILGEQALLARDTAIIAVSPGEVLDQVYRVDAVDDNSVSLTYLPLGRRVVIAR